MKRIVLVLALLFVPNLAQAQCGGVFPSHSICGNSTGSSATPRATTQGALSSLTLTPTPNSLMQGLNITQSAAGAVSTYTALNNILISSDTVAATTGAGILLGLNLDHLVGPGDQGARTALEIELRRVGAANAANALYQDVAASFSFNGQSNNNGTVGTPKGNGFAFYTSAQLKNNATYWSVLNGGQIGLGIETGSSSNYAIGFRIGHNPNHAVKGTTYDTALDFVDDVTATAGWDALITSSNVGGNYPIASTGTYIRTLGSQTFTNGIDMSSATITGDFLKGPSAFEVTGAGIVKAPQYQFGSIIFAATEPNFIDILEPAGGISIRLGNVAGGANYYDAAAHIFRDRGGATAFLTVNGNGLTIPGSSSGSLAIKPAAAAGTGSTLILPGGSTDFSATGGTSQVVKQTTSGGAFTVGQVAPADISGLGTGVATALGVNVGSPGAVLVNGSAAPTIASGFCSTGTPTAISASNGTAAFDILIGTATCGSTGTLTMPAATTGWVCAATDVTTPATHNIVQTGTQGSTTAVVLTDYARTTGIAQNFNASDHIHVMCARY